MKKLIVLLVAILASTQIFANEKTEKKNTEDNLRNELVVLLKKPEIELSKEEIKANIEFILNTKGEIVILTVDSEKEEIENFVKSRLNYKKIDANSKKITNKVYKFSLKVLKA